MKRVIIITIIMVLFAFNNVNASADCHAAFHSDDSYSQISAIPGSDL